MIESLIQSDVCYFLLVGLPTAEQFKLGIECKMPDVMSSLELVELIEVDQFFKQWEMAGNVGSQMFDGIE